jgi:hypothetical protein
VARIILLPVLLLQACAISGLEDWPDELPPVQRFIELYEQDPVNQQAQSRNEYLYWVIAFYQGNSLYPNGWLDVEEALIPAGEERTDFALGLQRLGVRIAGEWSKENPLRLIDNRMLQMWGSVLQIAMGYDQERRAVQVIGDDIDRLFAGTIEGDELTDGRYEQLLDIDLFGGF